MLGASVSFLRVANLSINSDSDVPAMIGVSSELIFGVMGSGSLVRSDDWSLTRSD